MGVGYAACVYSLAGVHWVYGSVAALLTTMSGLLPDLDSGTGVELKAFTGVLGVLAALFVWTGLSRLYPPPVFETHLWAMVMAYVAVRHGIRRFARRFSVHRGMSHSFPTCGVWGSLTYLYYPSELHSLRLLMAVAVMLGFLSHLFLDEVCSVDLKGARVNKAFGTAMKFWAPSTWSTLAMYGLLSLLSWQVIAIWPEEPFAVSPPPAPVIPYTEHARQIRKFALEVKNSPAVRARLDRIELFDFGLLRANLDGATDSDVEPPVTPSLDRTIDDGWFESPFPETFLPGIRRSALPSSKIRLAPASPFRPFRRAFRQLRFRGAGGVGRDIEFDGR